MTTEEKRIDEEKSSQLDRPEPIPGFPEFGHIPFEGLHNTRDLGGMPTADGRTIAPAKLLRSGALHKASEQDLARLVGDYDLAGVIDFRTQLERDKEPDPRELMEGVVFYDFPALSGETIGITHGAGVAQGLKTFASYNAGPHELRVRHVPADPAGRGGAGRLHVVPRGAFGRRRRSISVALYRGQGSCRFGRRHRGTGARRARGLRARRLSGHEPVRPQPRRGDHRRHRRRSCGLRAGSMRTSTRCSTPTTTTTTAPWRR